MRFELLKGDALFVPNNPNVDWVFLAVVKQFYKPNSNQVLSRFWIMPC